MFCTLRLLVTSARNFFYTDSGTLVADATPLFDFEERQDGFDV